MPNAKLLREILDSQLEMVCRFRRDGTIVFVNRAYAAMTGMTADGLVGQSLWQFIPVEDHARVTNQIDSLTPGQSFVVIDNRFETPEGIRWTRWRNHGLTWDEDSVLLEAQATGFDVTAWKQLEEQRQLLIDELNHRVRNTLTVVQGLAHQTFRGADVPPVPLATFNARLHALAGAHSALSRSNWEGADMSEVVREGLASCGSDSARITTAGPKVRIRPGASVALVLVLHELATNALKYGALSADSGRVSVRWILPGDDRFALTWHETGGPPVSEPSRSGFGSRLITSSISRQLGGQVDFDFAAAGLICRLDFPLHSTRPAGEHS